MEYEQKYIFPPEYTPYIQRQLATLCLPDSQYAKNTIHSLYFDTHAWDYAMDKASSDYLKTKVRIRWYDSAADRSQNHQAFLEIKGKTGTKRSKQRIEISVAVLDQLLAYRKASDSSAISSVLDDILRLNPELPTDLRPSMHIWYDRHRFYDGFSNSRISLDTAIYCQAIAKDLGNHLDETLPHYVLEVKGHHHHLPRILRPSVSPLVQKAAFSKYYESYKLLAYYEQ